MRVKTSKLRRNFASKFLGFFLPYINVLITLRRRVVRLWQRKTILFVETNFETERQCRDDPATLGGATFFITRNVSKKLRL